MARILVKITVHNWLEDVADPCCGTGTIPHEVIELKGDKIGMSNAIATTWASDKYNTPLQVANLSMVSCDTINLANRLFQKDVFELKNGDIVKIINPVTGELVEEIIPLFGAICSNLPFISSNNISSEEKLLTRKYIDSNLLDGKSDLSYYIVLHLVNLLKVGGYLGVILSNSWLGTKAGEKFYQALTNLYDLKEVHISGKGRWFANADVVTTILVLQRKINRNQKENATSFFVWKKSLDTIASNYAIEQQIVNSALLNKVIDYSAMSQSVYTESQITDLRGLNISYNALFHDVSWLLNIKASLVPLKSLFKVIRGSRRGWDDLFFPGKKSGFNVEDKFMKPALFNAKDLTKMLATPDRKAFCCSESLDVLEKTYPKAYNWIKQFESLTNNVGKPLTESLKMSNCEWYEMKPNEVVQFFTMMNPDKRLFFGRFKEPTFINQRIIGLLAKTHIDEELCHALLNSVLMKFYVEAVGFGRGLGVLDINKASIESCFILNPSLLSTDAIKDIKEKFAVVLAKDIMSVEAEMKDKDWVDFNQTVLSSFGLDNYYLRICNSLLSLRQVRKTAKETAKIPTMIKDIKNREFKGNIISDTSVSMVAESKKAN